MSDFHGSDLRGSGFRDWRLKILGYAVGVACCLGLGDFMSGWNTRRAIAKLQLQIVMAAEAKP